MQREYLKLIFSEIIEGYSFVPSKLFGDLKIKHINNFDAAKTAIKNHYYFEKAVSQGLEKREDKIDYLKGLHVDVSPSICVEFQHFKNKIIEKINSYFGYEAVKEIKIRQKFIKREVINKSVIKNYNNNELTKEILKTKIKDENLKKSVVNLGLSIKNTK